MIVLRCTQRLLKRSGFPVLAEPPESELPMGEWYANAVPLPFPGRSLVIYTASNTLLTVVTPGRSLRTTIPIFQQRLPTLLARLDLPAEWIARHAAGASEVCVARTVDRRVLGSMNDIAKVLRYDAGRERSFYDLDLTFMELDLVRMPMSLIGYRGSQIATADLVRESA